jgi:hypothetical protein
MVALGCQTPGGLEGLQPRSIVHAGSMTIAPDADLAMVLRFGGGKKQFQLMQATTVTGTAKKFIISVTGDKLTKPYITELDIANCTDPTVLNISNLPAGTVSVTVNVVDEAGKVLAYAQNNNVTISHNTTTQLDMNCEVADGKLAINFNCDVCGLDGSPMPSTPPSSGPWPVPSPWASGDCTLGPVPPAQDPAGVPKLNQGHSLFSSVETPGDPIDPCSHWSSNEFGTGSWYEYDFDGTVNLSSVFIGDLHGGGGTHIPLAVLSYRDAAGVLHEFDRFENDIYLNNPAHYAYTYRFATPVVAKAIRVDFSGHPLNYGMTNLGAYGF